MAQGERITQELSIGGVVSKTFDLYRRNFAQYVVLFVVVEAITGALTTVVRRSIILPTLPTGATAQQGLNFIPAFFGALILLTTLSGIVSLILYPIAYGGAIKFASEQIDKGSASLGTSVGFAFSRILWLWVVGLVVGVIVFLGFIALIVPGIILAIMFSLVVPVIIIEGQGFGSLGRSRKLVSQRWLKTLALFIIFGIIIGVLQSIASAISAPFGIASTIVSSILSGLFLPLIPIMLTVYYYSNVARIEPPQMTPPPPPPGASQAGVKYCPNCGAQFASTTLFCPSCGTKQPE